MVQPRIGDLQDIVRTLKAKGASLRGAGFVIKPPTGPDTKQE